MGGADELSFAHHSDPIVLEFNRLQNQLKGLSPHHHHHLSLPSSYIFFLALCIENINGYVVNWFLEIGSLSISNGFPFFWLSAYKTNGVCFELIF